MTEQTNLMPCPFCGTTPKRWVHWDILHVECPDCVSVGFHNHVRLGCLAEEEWNTRAEKEGGMKYYPKAVEFHGMDMALANDLERLETLPFRTQQLILMSVGREAIGFVVDGTEATPELIKDAFKSACDFHLRAEKEGRTA